MPAQWELVWAGLWLIVAALLAAAALWAGGWALHKGIEFFARAIPTADPESESAV